MNNSVTSIVIDLGDRKLTFSVSEARKLREELDRLFLIERKEFFRNAEEMTILPTWAYWQNWKVDPVQCEVPTGKNPFHKVEIVL